MINEIKNGDIFDIGQTVNGCSDFAFLDGEFFYYYNSAVQGRYGYDQEDLKNLILNDEFVNSKIIRNLFD